MRTQPGVSKQNLKDCSSHKEVLMEHQTGSTAHAHGGAGSSGIGYDVTRRRVKECLSSSPFRAQTPRLSSWGQTAWSVRLTTQLQYTLLVSIYIRIQFVRHRNHRCLMRELRGTHKFTAWRSFLMSKQAATKNVVMIWTRAPRMEHRDVRSDRRDTIVGRL